jgi:hypothetical protein
MSIPQPHRVVTCIHPTPGLSRNGSYIVLRDVVDPLTKGRMVELAGNVRYWAFRFDPGPPPPPKGRFMFGE